MGAEGDIIKEVQQEHEMTYYEAPFWARMQPPDARERASAHGF
jgi:hypothetical protein